MHEKCMSLIKKYQNYVSWSKSKSSYNYKKEQDQKSTHILACRKEVNTEILQLYKVFKKCLTSKRNNAFELFMWY